jgi:hypothetical protein
MEWNNVPIDSDNKHLKIHYSLIDINEGSPTYNRAPISDDIRL